MNSNLHKYKKQRAIRNRKPNRTKNRSEIRQKPEHFHEKAIAHLRKTRTKRMRTEEEKKTNEWPENRETKEAKAEDEDDKKL